MVRMHKTALFLAFRFTLFKGKISIVFKAAGAYGLLSGPKGPALITVMLFLSDIVLSITSNLCVCCSLLSVRADVQSPQVCLLNCELLLSELYIGVPAKATVTLFNQTLLPSRFSWMVRLHHYF